MPRARHLAIRGGGFLEMTGRLADPMSFGVTWGGGWLISGGFSVGTVTLFSGRCDLWRIWELIENHV